MDNDFFAGVETQEYVSSTGEGVELLIRHLDFAAMIGAFTAPAEVAVACAHGTSRVAQSACVEAFVDSPDAVSAQGNWGPGRGIDGLVRRFV